jgi:endonuclease/exonuclease/phosphatase family metal-dependent hydrolase
MRSDLSHLSGRRALARAVAASVGVSVLLVPVTASGDPTRPAAPAGLAAPIAIHVVTVSSSSFTVASHSSTNATHYRVFASTVKSDLAVARISSAHKSALSTKPRVTVKGLPYSTDPYYYRVEATNGSRHAFSTTIGSVGLRPATPHALSTTHSNGAVSLTWKGGSGTGFTITQATDAGMTQHVRHYRLRGPDHQFTPYGLTKGTTYYFRIRALNDTTPSASYSATAQATATTSEQSVSIMTYNILQATNDGTSEGGQIVAPWSQRRLAAAKLIKAADPDVIAIQEGCSWAGKVKGPRQVDTLRTALGGTYALADTEIPPSQPHYFRTGDYLLYKKADYKAIGAGGHWTLGTTGKTRFSAYQVLENRKTGARFIAVSTHLQVGAGAKWDAHREAQTKSLLTQSRAYAKRLGLPIVYAGDFNSRPGNHVAFDGAGIAMRADHISDAHDVAQTLSNQRYNSANGYLRTPPAFRDYIDHVYVPPGVAVTSWKLILALKHGRFVGVMPSDHNPLVATVRYPY